MHVVTLDTGTGKTMSAAAFIAAAHKADPEFSCAYIAPQVKGLIRMQEALLDLGCEPAIWFSNRSGDYADDIAAANGNSNGSYIPDKGKLKDHPIVLVTHKLWQDDIRSSVTNYDGKRRRLFIIDECPDIVETFSATSDVSYHAKLSRFEAV